MYELGEIPDLGVVPERMYAQLIRPERYGEPRTAFQIEAVPVPSIGPREVLVYFNHQARFDVTQALELLDGTGVRCPHISTYIRTLVDYVRRNPNKMFLDQRAL